MLLILSFVSTILLNHPHRQSDLERALMATAPGYMTPEKARLHVSAAMAAETPEMPAELLLSMAYLESRYDPRATSRVFKGKREGGIPKWKTPPKGVSGPYFCGVTQVTAGYSWTRCLEFRDIRLAYKTAVHEGIKWQKACRKDRELLRCALWGYGGGYPAIKKRTSTYPARVLSRAQRISNKVKQYATKRATLEEVHTSFRGDKIERLCGGLNPLRIFEI